VKKYLFILLAFAVYNTHAQIEAGLLFGLSQGTTAEIHAISRMEEGQMRYNTDTPEIFTFNGTVWIKSSNTNWLQSGNTSENGSFLGSTNDVAINFRPHKFTLLQFGRRQTLGLTHTGGSTSISIVKQVINFQLKENDMLAWTCRTVSGSSRLSYASLTFEFGY
jgi:hypothetical protein